MTTTSLLSSKRTGITVLSVVTGLIQLVLAEVCHPVRRHGYRGKAEELRTVLEELPDDPVNDRIMIERWAPVVGLEGSFHFKPYTTD